MQTPTLARSKRQELPAFLRERFKRAYRLEWLTVIYLLSVTVIMFLAMGSSAAMKAAWIEDLVSLFPALAFLTASHFYNHAPNSRFPYGYHKAFTVAYIAAALALLILGLYILFDSAIGLIKQEHPTIGTINLFGREVWLGWLMIAALVYSFVPALFLGRIKMPLASELHEKVLYTDSQAQKADWMTAGAGIVGIVLVGFGWWWADSVAAIIISFSIVHDGFKQCRGGMRDLMEQSPVTFDDSAEHPLTKKMLQLCLAQHWVKEARVRMREHGMVFFSDIFVVPHIEENLIANIEDLSARARDLDWKIYDVVISPVHTLPASDAGHDSM